MLKNLFYHKNKRVIHQGDKTSATPIREAHALPTQAEANAIDRQEARIRQLEREAKSNSSLHFYMYGY